MPARRVVCAGCGSVAASSPCEACRPKFKSRTFNDPDYETYRQNAAYLKDLCGRQILRCPRCFAPVTPSNFSAGHRVAVADGGTHAMSNLRAEHRDCNFANKAKLKYTRP